MTWYSMHKLRPWLLLLFVLVFVAAPLGAADSGSKPTVQFGIIPRYNPMLMYRS
jgi:hypothetical protein